MLNTAKIAFVCAAIAGLWTCFQTRAQAAEVYGVEALGDRYVLRALDTDHPDFVREVATIPMVPGEELHALVQLDDRRIALLRSILASDESPHNELAVVGLPGQLNAIQAQDVAGLDTFATLSQLLVAWGARYYGLVGLHNDRPPYQLVTFSAASTGVLKLKSVELPSETRYANLTQCPDGTIYATSLAAQQGTRLVVLNPESGQVIERSQLTLNLRRLPSDIMSLTCDLNGRLYALADPTRRGTAALYSLDATTGTLCWLGNFAAHKVAFIKTR